LECNSRVAVKAKFCSHCAAPTNQEVGASGALARAKRKAVGTVMIAGETAKGSAKFVGSTAKEGLQSEMGKSIAMGAALGAVIAMPIPFIGSAFGASVGAIIGAVRKF
jgi:hypothetical protein